MRKTCLNEVYELAKKDPRVVFIGSDIGAGTLDTFKKEMPDRFFMEGVSESHLVSMMAGLAMTGKIPYFNTIATFLTRRPFEHVLLDGGLHNTQIRLIGSGGGLVYAPLGPTHLAIEDIALMRSIPGMTVIAPCDAEEMKRLMPQTLDVKGPIYIRLAKGGDPVVSRSNLEFKVGQGIVMEEGKDILIVSTGITTQIALEAHKNLMSQGISAGVIHMHTIKPLDKNLLIRSMQKVTGIITIEEHQIDGGLGSAVAEVIAETPWDEVKQLRRIGISNDFPHHYGSQAELLNHYRISSEHIMEVAKVLIKHKSAV